MLYSLTVILNDPEAYPMTRPVPSHRKTNLPTVWILVAIFLLTTAVLVLINRDIFTFREFYPVNRTFTPTIEHSGNFRLITGKTLRSGEYRIRFHGTLHRDAGYVLYDGDDILSTGYFTDDSIADGLPFAPERPFTDFGVGVYYDDSRADFFVDAISIESDFIVQPKKILRNAILSGIVLLLAALTALRIFRAQRFRRLFGLRDGKDELTVIALLLLTIAASFPLLNRGFLTAVDLQFHLMRIEGLSQSIRPTDLFPRIYRPVLYDYGYGSGFYYPDFFLLLPALLRKVGFSLLESYKLFTIAFNLLAIVFMYRWTARVTRSRRGALLAAALYAFAPYRLTTIYDRGALGEMQTLAFLPLILAGIYDLIAPETPGAKRFALGFSALILSHLIGVAIMFIVALLIFVLTVDILVREPRRLSRLIGAIPLVLALTAVFWLPMLEQLLGHSVRASVIFSNESGAPDLMFALPLSDLFAAFVPYTFIEARHVFGLAFWAVIGAIGVSFPRFIRAFRAESDPTSRRESRYLIALAAVGLLFLFASTDRFPWGPFAWFYNRIQFGFRLLMVPSCIFAFFGGVIFARHPDKLTRRAFTVGLIALLLAGLLPHFAHLARNRTNDPDRFVLEINRIMRGEWLPENANPEEIEANGNAVIKSNDQLRIIHTKRGSLSFTFSYETDQPLPDETVVFEVPLLYYVGYRAERTLPDGRVEPLATAPGAHGMVETRTDASPAATIRVYYQKTTLQSIGETLSLFSVIALILSSAAGPGMKNARAFCRRRRADVTAKHIS